MPLSARPFQIFYAMNEIINTLSSNRLVLLIAIFLLAFILYALFNRIIKLVIILVIVIVLYTGYLYFSGQKIPETKEDAIKQGSEEMKRIQEDSGKIFKKF